MACSSNCWGLFSSTRKVSDPSTDVASDHMMALICMLEKEAFKHYKFLSKTYEFHHEVWLLPLAGLLWAALHMSLHIFEISNILTECQ